VYCSGPPSSNGIVIILTPSPRLSFVFGPFSQTQAAEDFSVCARVPVRDRSPLIPLPTRAFPGTCGPLWCSEPTAPAPLWTRARGDGDPTNAGGGGDVALCARLGRHRGGTLAGGRGIRSRRGWVRKLFQKHDFYYYPVFIDAWSKIDDDMRVNVETVTGEVNTYRW